MITVFHYVQDNGHVPFDEWWETLRDKRVKTQVLRRLRQLEAGNWGDSVSGGEGVIELRIKEGPGHRIYCGRYGDTIVILLCGGDKSTQPADLRRAKRYWAEWKRSHK
jgi:putative addiction module killer protein